MAEDSKQVQEQAEEKPQGEPAKPEIDWKAECRKWEARAKKSESAEKELAELKAAQMSEQEKVLARAEAAEKDLAALKAQQELVGAAKEISDSSGCPREFLELCSDRDKMEAMAKLYADEHAKRTPHAAPKAKASIVNREDGKQMDVRDKFAALFD